MTKRKLDAQAPVPAGKKQKVTLAAPPQQKKKKKVGQVAQPLKAKSKQIAKPTTMVQSKTQSNKVAATTQPQNNSSQSGKATTTSQAQNNKQNQVESTSNQQQPESKKRKAENEVSAADSKRMKLAKDVVEGRKVPKKPAVTRPAYVPGVKNGDFIEFPIGQPYQTVKGFARFSQKIVEVPLGYHPRIKEGLRDHEKPAAEASANEVFKRNQTRRGLFSLPAELRKMIYGYAVSQNRPIAIKQKSPAAIIMEKAPLMFTCKQVYHECIDEFFYGQNSFVADSTDILNGWLKSLEPSHLKALKDKTVCLLDPAKPESEKHGVELELAKASKSLAAIQRARLELTMKKNEKKALDKFEAENAAFEKRMIQDRADSHLPDFIPTMQNIKTGNESSGPYTLRHVRRNLEGIRYAVGRKGLGKDVVQMELNVTDAYYVYSEGAFFPRNHHQFLRVTADEVGPDDDSPCKFKSDVNPRKRKQRYTRMKTAPEAEKDKVLRQKRKEKARKEKEENIENTLALQQASAARKARQKANRAKKVANQVA